MREVDPKQRTEQPSRSPKQRGSADETFDIGMDPDRNPKNQEKTRSKRGKKVQPGEPGSDGERDQHRVPGHDPGIEER